MQRTHGKVAERQGRTRDDEEEESGDVDGRRARDGHEPAEEGVRDVRSNERRAVVPEIVEVAKEGVCETYERMDERESEQATSESVSQLVRSGRLVGEQRGMCAALTLFTRHVEHILRIRPVNELGRVVDEALAELDGDDEEARHGEGRGLLGRVLRNRGLDRVQGAPSEVVRRAHGSFDPRAKRRCRDARKARREHRIGAQDRVRHRVTAAAFGCWLSLYRSLTHSNDWR